MLDNLLVCDPCIRNYEKIYCFWESRYYGRITSFFLSYFVHCCSPCTFAASYWAFCPCSLYLVCLDVCDEAEKTSNRQPSHLGSHSLHCLPILLQPGVGSMNVAFLPWCSLLWLFIYSASVSVKPALRSASPIPALHILAWSPSGRMSEPVWG